jgi:hypothetical protein
MRYDENRLLQEEHASRNLAAKKWMTHPLIIGE